MADTQSTSNNSLEEELPTCWSGLAQSTRPEPKQHDISNLPLPLRLKRHQPDSGFQDEEADQEPRHRSKAAHGQKTASPSVSAVQLVFKHTQLLEHILHFVDLYTLLHSTKTTKSFLKTILQSPTLRQKLWIDAPSRYDRRLEPTMSPFLTHFRSNLAINAWIKQEYEDGSTVYLIRFGPKEQMLMIPRGTWRDMVVFRPNSKATGVLKLRVETLDTPCVYNVFPMTLEWHECVKMGSLVDMLVADEK